MAKFVKFHATTQHDYGTTVTGPIWVNPDYVRNVVERPNTVDIFMEGGYLIQVERHVGKIIYEDAQAVISALESAISPAPVSE